MKANTHTRTHTVTVAHCNRFPCICRAAQISRNIHLIRSLEFSLSLLVFSLRPLSDGQNQTDLVYFLITVALYTHIQLTSFMSLTVAALWNHCNKVKSAPSEPHACMRSVCLKHTPRALVLQHPAARLLVDEAASFQTVSAWRETRSTRISSRIKTIYFVV